MTTDTGTIDLSMVDSIDSNWRPKCRKFFMAGIAHIRRINMRWSFTTGADTVVTGNTISSEVSVINCCRNPLLRTMAIVTFLRCRYMVSTFARGNNIVVAA